MAFLSKFMVSQIWGKCNIELYIQVANITGGPPDKKDVLLDECDPVWLELRDRHLGFVSLVPTHLFGISYA